MKRYLRAFLAIALAVVIIVGLIYWGYSVNRWWNWKFGYEGRTQTLIEKAMKEHIEKYHKEQK